MGVPRAHSTRGQKGRRRSHLALRAVALVACEHCGQSKMAHSMCALCGYYGSREVVNVVARELKKKEKRKKKAQA